ncbi:protein maelstrom 2 [Acyrthosiphon pisum]|uniref:Maelstrom domain-containing protein n=1 Tax=Acyrthosiphon pisum TaxID=7029 RepID=A0A8R2B7B9_ACYPI|nr:protein maelstrom 2 [Acyrthosiphon pisum]|eukprot:XP_008185055.1 PREDICTED: protein maelstrom 2 [Acyrthosiphon pisum]
MTDDEKNKYKVLADEFNSTQLKKQPLKQIRDLQDNSHDFWNMQKYLTEMFECISNNEELFKKKFILLHINCHTENIEQYYFPAEIAALEFSLIDGIYRTYHQVIGISKIYPRGFAGSMKQFSDRFHRIVCFDEHPDDYQQILLEFSTFLKDGIINHEDLKEGTLDLPYLFTIESEVGTNMMHTKNSLERLYSTVYPRVDDERCKSIFKIGNVEGLFLEIKKKINLNMNIQNLISENSVLDILESDMYGYGLGCQYHECREISYKCSKARVIQWMSNICKHICENTGITLNPGRHTAVELRNGSKLIIENAHLPLSKEDLNIC